MSAALIPSQDERTFDMYQPLRQQINQKHFNLKNFVSARSENKQDNQIQCKKVKRHDLIFAIIFNILKQASLLDFKAFRFVEKAIRGINGRSVVDFVSQKQVLRLITHILRSQKLFLIKLKKRLCLGIMNGRMFTVSRGKYSMPDNLQAKTLVDKTPLYS